MADRPDVVVHPDASSLAADVAARAIDVLAAVQAAGRVPSLVLTAGSILEKVFAALPTCVVRDRVDWSRVEVFWGDERFVPDGSDERNDTPAKATLFAGLPFDPARLHAAPTSDGPIADADDAARAYAAEITAVLGDDPHFDLALIGMGPDGHCCSLFPHHPGLTGDGLIIGVHDSPKPPPTRLSFTFDALARIDQVWFVASGDGKAEAVSRALGGADWRDVPSARPRGREATVWLLDRDAAALLPT